MTQRDIAKDKEMCEAATPGPWEATEFDVTKGYRYEHGKHIAEWIADLDTGDDNREDEQVHADAHFIAEAREALPYWIAQYEAAQAKLDELGSGKYVLMLADTYNKDVENFKALQARITELESRLHPNNRPDVAKPQTHAQMMSEAIDKLAEHERR